MFSSVKKEVGNGWSFPEQHVRETETCLHVRVQPELERRTITTCQKHAEVRCCTGTQEIRNNTR